MSGRLTLGVLLRFLLSAMLSSVVLCWESAMMLVSIAIQTKILRTFLTPEYRHELFRPTTLPTCLSCYMMTIVNTMLLNPAAFRFTRDDDVVFRQLEEFFAGRALLLQLGFEANSYGLCVLTTMASLYATARMLTYVLRQKESTPTAASAAAYWAASFGAPAFAIFLLHEHAMSVRVRRDAFERIEHVAFVTSVVTGAGVCHYIIAHSTILLFMCVRGSSRANLSHTALRLLLYTLLLGGISALLFVFSSLIQDDVYRAKSCAPVVVLALNVYCTITPLMAYALSKSLNAIRLNKVERRSNRFL